MNRGRGLGICLLFAIAVNTLAGGNRIAAAEEIDNWAEESFHSITDKFWNPKDQGFQLFYQWGINSPGHNCSELKADYWISTQALEFLLDNVDRTHGREGADLVQQFYQARQANQSWLQKAPYIFYDDETWMALGLIHAHASLSAPQQTSPYLETAKMLFDNVEKAWDETCCGSHPGGIWFSIAHKQKSTVSNIGAVIAAAKLSQLLNDREYLDFALKVYRYWMKEMSFSPYKDMLAIRDRIFPDGQQIADKLTYNEGVMVGAAVALYEATHELKFLQQARAFAKFIMEQETVRTALGPILTDPAPTDNFFCTLQGPPYSERWYASALTLEHHKDIPLFKYITFRYLAQLGRIEENTQRKEKIRDFLRVNATSIWQVARDRRSGLFSANWEEQEPSIPGSVLSSAVAGAGALSEIAAFR